MYLKIWVLTTIFCMCEFAAGRSVDKSAVELIYTSNLTYVRVVSNFVYVKLKSQWQAKIALTETPFPSTWSNFDSYSRRLTESIPEPLYQFSLHDFTKDYSTSEFRVNGHVHATVETDGEFLSSDNFVEFLIYWNSNFLIMSRLGDPFPLFHWKETNSSILEKIKYIGICVDQEPRITYPWTRGDNYWIINFSSPINLSDAFAPFFKSSSNPLLKTDLAVNGSVTELPKYSWTTESPENAT